MHTPGKYLFSYHKSQWMPKNALCEINKYFIHYQERAITTNGFYEESKKEEKNKILAIHHISSFFSFLLSHIYAFWTRLRLGGTMPSPDTSWGIFMSYGANPSPHFFVCPHATSLFVCPSTTSFYVYPLIISFFICSPIILFFLRPYLSSHSCIFNCTSYFVRIPITSYSYKFTFHLIQYMFTYHLVLCTFGYIPPKAKCATNAQV